MFTTVGVDQRIEYVDSDFDEPPPGSAGSIVRTYAGGDLGEVTSAILRDRWFDAPYRDLALDARLVAERIGAELRRLGVAAGATVRAEMVRSPFYRRKGAYLVGRLDAGGIPLPFALAFLNTAEGVTADAALVGDQDLSVLFSFTRSHFHVEAGPPARLVRLLHELMPEKRLAELYIAIGFHKHGKTELYRDLLRHLRTTDDRFELARGTPGLVMIVFTMPGFDVVVKVIRDRFPPSKSVTRDAVMRKYRLVFRHDRAGRLVEAQEFEHLEFDRERFTPEAFEELTRAAGRTVDVEGDQLIVHHAYIERRVEPLDVFVRDADPRDASLAVVDMGQAVKDLAATDIFPGDLLPKNFGVTRHGRVVLLRLRRALAADGPELPVDARFGLVRRRVQRRTVVRRRAAGRLPGGIPAVHLAAAAVARRARGPPPRPVRPVVLAGDAAPRAQRRNRRHLSLRRLATAARRRRVRPRG